MDVLRSHFEVVHLHDAVARVTAGKPVAGLASVTFDDGFACFKSAYDVLLQRGIPVTHYVVSSCVASGLPTWNYRLNRINAARRGGPLLLSAFATMAAGEREEALLQLEAELPWAPRLPDVLREADLAEFDSDLVEWGSHTVSHAMLGRIGEDQIAREVEESAEKIEGWTGRPVRSLSYPNDSHTALAHRVVSSSGRYAFAAAVGQRPASASDSRWAVPRIDINMSNEHRFRLEVAGATQAARRVRAALR